MDYYIRVLFISVLILTFLVIFLDVSLSKIVK